MINILIGCTGSVASIKVFELVQLLQKTIPGSCIRIVATEHAKHFFNCNVIAKQFEILEDKNEWQSWSKMGDPVLHIQLRNWADILVIAPLDANTLGKLAYGLCDNLLTCIARAWDIKNKPLLFCPAMNTLMWHHPSTNRNLDILKDYGYDQIPPISKQLACGEEGIGAMADIKDIVKKVAYAVQLV